MSTITDTDDDILNKVKQRTEWLRGIPRRYWKLPRAPHRGERIEGMIDNNIEDETNEREIRRIRRRELSERLPFHCGQLMRYDEIENGDVLDRRRLTGTYYCERCCTMQPTYEDVNDDAPATPERGDDDGVNRYLKSEIEHLLKENSTLIAQRERLLRLLRPVTSPTACYCAVMKSEKCWHCEARELITTIEQDQIVTRTTSEQEGRR